MDREEMILLTYLTKKWLELEEWRPESVAIIEMVNNLNARIEELESR